MGHRCGLQNGIYTRQTLSTLLHAANLSEIIEVPNRRQVPVVQNIGTLPMLEERLFVFFA
jgi:hypothetical protein